MSDLSLGFDLGGTNLRAALVDGEGRIHGSERHTLEDRSPAAVVEAMAASARALTAQSAGASVKGCGIGVAGQLRGATGVVALGPNLGWHEVPLGPMVSQRLSMPAHVVNDLKAAAWGELKAGSARGDRDVYTVFVGTGVGSAIVAEGRLVWGATGVAGELGHVKVVPDGRACGCGERGCLEAYVGGVHLVAQLKEAVAQGSSPKLAQLCRGDVALLTPALLEQAAHGGDAFAIRLYERTVELLSLVLANQVTVLNPAHLVLGGGVLAGCPGLYRRLVDGIARFASGTARQALRVSPPSLGDDSGLVGAALLAHEP